MRIAASFLLRSLAVSAVLAIGALGLGAQSAMAQQYPTGQQPAFIRAAAANGIVVPANLFGLPPPAAPLAAA